MLLKIKGIEFKVTAHAKHRMFKRGVSVNDLVAALEDQKSCRTIIRNGKKPRKGIIGKNGVTVIYEDETKTIITVYNHKKEYYVSKNKAKRNQNKLRIKRKYGNRTKNK